MRLLGHCRTRDSNVKSRGRRLEGKLEGKGRLPRRRRKLQTRRAGRREGQREGRRQPGQGRRRRVSGRELLRDSASRRSPGRPSIPPTGPQEHTAGWELTGPLAHFREALHQVSGTASLARVQSLVARAWETAVSRFFSRPEGGATAGRSSFIALGASG